MMLFWILAGALVAAALAFLLPPLLRRRAAAPDARVAANAEIYREQLEELGAELQRGALTKDEHERATRELERRIVAEHAAGHAAAAPQEARHRPLRPAAIAVAVLLPLGALLGYFLLGDPRGLDPVATRPSDEQQLRALVDRLTAHLKQKPDDPEGWALMGRALISMGHYERGAQSLARAVQLSPENRELLVEFIKALAIAGRAEFEQRNYAAAIGYWERILPFAPPESEFARTVAESIAEAKQLAGATAASVRGLVTLDPSLRGKVAPGDTVFVLARPAEGSRMPLAVTRTTVDKLPYAFTLDDGMAMSPASRISGHASVVVLARVSKSGKPAAQKGDIEGVSAPVAPGAANVQVVISKIVP
jgi:cytochrome c-type biogenesis protein CcmH